MQKYGVTNFTKTKEYIIKTKETCLQRYGVDNYNKTEESKNKIKQTCLERYGVEYYFQSKEKQIKSIQTCLKKYGVENYVQTEEYKERNRQICLERYGTVNGGCSSKAHDTFIKNKSYNKSIPENIIFNILNQKYDDIIRQYYSSKYTYNCDFYIESLQLYIEYHGSMFHNKHMYRG